jgi:hypothetical protein
VIIHFYWPLVYHLCYLTNSENLRILYIYLHVMYICDVGYSVAHRVLGSSVGYSVAQWGTGWHSGVQCSSVGCSVAQLG